MKLWRKIQMVRAKRGLPRASKDAAKYASVFKGMHKPSALLLSMVERLTEKEAS